MILRPVMFTRMGSREITRAVNLEYFDIDLTVMYNTDVLSEHRYGRDKALKSKIIRDDINENARPQLIAAGPIRKAFSSSIHSSSTIIASLTKRLSIWLRSYHLSASGFASAGCTGRT